MLPADCDANAGGRGTLFEVGESADKALYTTEGWYSWQVFISIDGKHLARVGNWPRSFEHDPSEYVAIAFYQLGELVKSYTVSDLVPDAELEHSISHYRYIENVQWNRSAWSYQLRVEFVNGKVRFFNIRSGALEESSYSSP